MKVKVEVTHVQVLELEDDYGLSGELLEVAVEWAQTMDPTRGTWTARIVEDA